MNEQTCEQSLTHHVSLVLDNEQATYKARRAIVHDWLWGVIGSRVHDDDEPTPRGDEPVEPTPAEVHELAERLKDWCEELVGLEHAGEDQRLGEAGRSLQREILSTALAWVEWDDLATDWGQEQAGEMEQAEVATAERRAWGGGGP